jgi:tetratricopeptide (TPR) repeat protein
MAATVSSALPPRPRTWIVSPAWDLVYLVLTPLAIVPIVLVAVRRWLSPEQVYLAVISFASLGHHLPGFMRAYGDRELFARYRWRFLLAPPLALGLALLFTPPATLRSTLGLSWTHLHGLELILLVWGTWHGLMQTYGFMRIYDLRRGENDRTGARLDHALCVAMFVAGVVFSDTRMFGVAGAMWQSGLPVFGPEALGRLRWTVGAASLAVVGLYAVHLAKQWRRGRTINFVKLLLAATTGWFYWYCGRLSTNLLVGVAMFEIYHAVQYNAIVWVYNRRLFERARERFGPLGFLFRDRLTMLGVYLAAIAAYSSIRFFTAQSGDRMFSGDLADARQWLVALFVASSLLHFYYDGFIWKVSERKTRENLVDEAIEASGGPASGQQAGRWRHVGKWAAFAAIAAALFLAERQSSSGNAAERQAAQRKALAELTPEVPEARMLASQQALAAGDKEKSAELARQAAADRPDSHQSQAELAWSLIEAKKFAEARRALERAIELKPDVWAYHADLAETSAKLGDNDRAIAAYRRAIALAPKELEPVEGLAALLLQLNRPQEAVELLGATVRSTPGGERLQTAYGAALSAAGQYQSAIEALKRAHELDPKSAEVRYQLGVIRLKQGQPDRAATAFEDAIKHDPKHFLAHLQLGDALMAAGKASLAEVAYRKAVVLRPDVPEAWVCLADAQLDGGRAAEAEQTLRDGLARRPDSPELNLTLGLLLEHLGRPAEGRALLDLAAKQGLKVNAPGGGAAAAEPADGEGSEPATGP